MYISTASIDEILGDLDANENPALNGLAQALRTVVSDIANVVIELDSRIDELEGRLKKLE